METVSEIVAPVGEPISQNHKTRDDKNLAESVDLALAGQINPADTVVVSGFWRSGTTWLEEALTKILDAKTVFEPFHFMVPAAKKIFKHAGVAKKSEPFRELFIPYCGTATLEMHSLLHQYYDHALRAGLSGRAVRVLRKSAAESYRTRVLVKFTRGQFSLHAAQSTFAMPLIHVFRDPRAVIASAKMTDWYWLFDHLRLSEQLLEPPDGRADFFRRWADEIRTYDHDKIARMAAYWAITEKFLLEAFANQTRRAVFVSYEELCRRPEILLHTLARQNVPIGATENLPDVNGDSFSTSAQRRGVSVEERISGWKKVLSRAEIATIENVIRHFGLDSRLEKS